MTQDIVEDLNQNSEKKNNIITQTALAKAIEESTDYKPDNLLRYGSAVFRKKREQLELQKLLTRIGSETGTIRI